MEVFTFYLNNSRNTINYLKLIIGIYKRGHSTYVGEHVIHKPYNIRKRNNSKGNDINNLSIKTIDF